MPPPRDRGISTTVGVTVHRDFHKKCRALGVNSATVIRRWIHDWTYTPEVSDEPARLLAQLQALTPAQRQMFATLIAEVADPHPALPLDERG